MKTNTVIRADMNDILFDDRNKAYGAYVIRKEYPRTIMNAFYITTATALTLLLVFWMLRDRPLPDLVPDAKFNLYEVNINRPLPRTPEPEPRTIPPAMDKESDPAPRAKGMDTQESANVKPTPDADPNATIAPDSAYKDKQPGETTTDSSSGKALGGDPNGTGKEGHEPPCKDCPPGTGTGTTPANTYHEPDPFEPFLGEMPIPNNMGDIRKLIGYPRDARDAQLEGKVTYRVLVDEKGRYVRHMVLRSSHPLFDKACAGHLTELRFTPGKMGDRTVPCWVVLPFTFKLMR